MNRQYDIKLSTSAKATSFTGMHAADTDVSVAHAVGIGLRESAHGDQRGRGEIASRDRALACSRWISQCQSLYRGRCNNDALSPRQPQSLAKCRQHRRREYFKSAAANPSRIQILFRPYLFPFSFSFPSLFFPLVSFLFTRWGAFNLIKGFDQCSMEPKSKSNSIAFNTFCTL